MKGTFIYEGVSFKSEEYYKLSKLQRIQKLLPIAIDKSFDNCIEYIENEYPSREVFLSAIQFTEFNLPEIVKISTPMFIYPLLELEETVTRSIYLAYSSFYKEAIVNLRSVLELSLVIAMFYIKYKKTKLSIDADQYVEKKEEVVNEIKEWLISKKETPKKNSFISFFKNEPNFIGLLNETTWKHDFNDIWNTLCDYSHVNGYKFMNMSFHNDLTVKSYPPEFKDKSFKIFCDNFVKVIQQVAIISAATRPELLDEEKAYQFEKQTKETLLSTGYWGGAISIFFDLIPGSYIEYFKKYHVEIKSI